MKLRRVISAGFLAWLLASPDASAQVQLQIEAGRVTMIARAATLAEMLAEWSRVGGTAFVNADKLPGERLDLELNGVSERAALEVLLRSASGYLIAARTDESTGRSQYLRVLVMPTSVAPQVATSGMPTAARSVAGRQQPVEQTAVVIGQDVGESTVSADSPAVAAESPAAADVSPSTTIEITTPRARPFGGVPIGSVLSQPGLIPERFLAFPQSPTPSGSVTAPAGSTTPGAINPVGIRQLAPGQTFSTRPAPPAPAPAAPAEN